jgi:hypothetical protein
VLVLCSMHRDIGRKGNEALYVVIPSTSALCSSKNGSMERSRSLAPKRVDTLYAGDAAFEVAAAAAPLSADNAAAVGGGAQVPSALGGAGGAVLGIASVPLGQGAAALGPDRIAVASKDGVVRMPECRVWPQIFLGTTWA